MHEVSVVRSLVELAEERLADSGADAQQVRAAVVTVRVGALSGLVPMALHFAFDVATHGTCLQGAQLLIEWTDVAVWCDKCQADRLLADNYRMLCPECGERTPKVVRGRELELVRIEIEDDSRSAQDSGSPDADSEEE